MSTPFLGSLLCTAFGFAPKGWADCNGQLVAINQNQALFALLGTFFGGDGRATFGLPDLRGRVALGTSTPAQQGAVGGQALHTLTLAEVPWHTHTVQATTNVANNKQPAGHLLAATSGSLTIYSNNPSNVATLNPGSVSVMAGGQPHENRQPFLVMNWIIALQGIFPPHN